MNKDFSRIITFLRKEQGISQKEAANKLGVSQALLSHYEKGIRECGLDFIVKVADYYDVSCDYLLGRTLQRNGATINVEDIQDVNNISSTQGTIITRINKKIMLNTTSVIFDILSRIGSKKLTNSVSNYLMESMYLIFRTLYNADSKNSQALFALDKNRYKNLCNASILMDIDYTDYLIEIEKNALPMSAELLSKYFDDSATYVFNLIQYAERNIKQNCIK